MIDAALGKVASGAAKLCEMTVPRWWLITKFSALTICGKPWVPRVSETGVSTSRMFAPGAIAWEYSTSSDVSWAQPTICGRLAGSNDGTLPAGVGVHRIADVQSESGLDLVVGRDVPVVGRI